MGYLSTVEMLSASGDVESVLRWHLTSNHYPPLPVSMVASCLDAIDAFNADDHHAPVTLPEGVTYKGHSMVPAWVVVDECHLEGFLYA